MSRLSRVGGSNFARRGFGFSSCRRFETQQAHVLSLAGISNMDRLPPPLGDGHTAARPVGQLVHASQTPQRQSFP